MTHVVAQAAVAAVGAVVFELADDERAMAAGEVVGRGGAGTEDPGAAAAPGLGLDGAAGAAGRHYLPLPAPAGSWENVESSAASSRERDSSSPEPPAISSRASPSALSCSA